MTKKRPKNSKKKRNPNSSKNLGDVFFYNLKNIKYDRITFLTAVIITGGFLILWRLFSLQVTEHHYYLGLAAARDGGEKQLSSLRGNIYVHDGPQNDHLFPIAVNRDLALLYAVPKNIESPARTTRLLDTVLKLDNRENVENQLSKENDPYEPIVNKLSPEVVEQVKDLDLDGIGFTNEKWRYYPSGNIFSHITGFLGFSKNERVGLYGAEGHFNDILSGKLQDNFFSQFFLDQNVTVQNPDLVLTIDRGVQFFACSKLQEYIERFAAESGNVIIMHSETGAILAMCNYPDFNPNQYSKVEDGNIYNNAALFEAFEPGSTFKAFTMAAALDTHVVNPSTTYIDNGFEKIGKYKISNVNGLIHGEQTMTNVLEKSLNTGSIYAANKVGFDTFRRYIYDFGFGEKTNIDLDYESKGDLNALKKRSEIYLATASFGQGITVTPMQMVAAFNSLANGGKLMKPYVLEEARYANGDIDKKEPEFVKQVISPRAASLVGGMLVSVVHNGHASGALVDGYYMGGKTGTAQVHDAEKGGYSEKTIQSFVGFGPVDKPLFTMITKLDAPANSEYSSQSAAPLFGEIAKFLLEYYKVPRDY